MPVAALAGVTTGMCEPSGVRKSAVLVLVLVLAGCGKTKTVYVPVQGASTPTTSAYCTPRDEPMGYNDGGPWTTRGSQDPRSASCLERAATPTTQPNPEPTVPFATTTTVCTRTACY